MGVQTTKDAIFGERELELFQEICNLKTQQKAIILAHFYQPPEIQRIADFVGDSLQLAQQAAKNQAEVIVMCGVHFMAETAAILCPDRFVLLPDKQAGCPMADMVRVDALRRQQAQIPGVLTICYINSTAAVKAESHICCTSSNAVRVVQSLPSDAPLLFIPDRNLGAWVQRETGRNMQFWEGYCPIHDQLTMEILNQIKSQYPDAEVVVHPECRPEVTAAADQVCSTAGMLQYVEQSSKSQFIIATEMGILYQFQTRFPEKEFILATPQMQCPDMKGISLEKLKQALETLAPKVKVDSAVAEKAELAIKRMLALG